MENEKVFKAAVEVRASRQQCRVVELNMEDLAILYAAKTIIPIAYRDYVKGHGAGMATWFGYYRGGMKKVWLDK
jgi:hypothetical protein